MEMDNETNHSKKQTCTVCGKILILGEDESILVSIGLNQKVNLRAACPTCLVPFPSKIECCLCFKQVEFNRAIQGGCNFIKLKMGVVRYYCSNRCEVKYNAQARKLPEMEIKKVCMNCRIVDPKVKKCSGCKRVYYCSISCQRADWPEHRTKCGD